MKSVNQDSKNNLKTTILLTLAFVLTAIVGATFAYFRVQSGLGANADIEATTGATETLSFSVGQAIDIKADQDNFAQGKDSITQSTTATAILTPATGSEYAERTYNVFLKIEHNDFEYTQEDQTPELIVNITDPKKEKYTKTILGLKGNDGNYDITTQEGYFLIAGDYPIKATEAIGTSQTWKIDVTLVNLDKEQNDNQGKTLEGSIYITTDKINTYESAKIKGIKDLKTTYKSISGTLDVEKGTKEITDYYVGIEEAPANQVEPVAFTFAQKAGVKYTRFEKGNFSFDGLDEKTKYIVYAYVVDENGVESNYYDSNASDITTEEYKLASIDEMEVTSTLDSITVNITKATPGTSKIKGYKYAIDDTWTDVIESPTHTFVGLNDTQRYNIKVVAVDELDKASAVKEEDKSTVTYILPTIESATYEPTYNSITVNAKGVKGTNEVASYEYKLDEGQWESGGETHIFDKLNEEESHVVYIKTVDTKGRKTPDPGYRLEVSTRAYKLPVINDITKKTTNNSITLTVDAKGLEADIKSYVFKKDGAETVQSDNSITYSDLTSNTTYNFEVKVIDENNRESSVNTFSLKTDYIEPTLRATATAEEHSVKITATFTKGSTDLDKYYYKLYKEGESIDWSEGTTEDFKEYQGLDSNTKYYYEVKAIDKEGHIATTEKQEITTKYENPSIISAEVINRSWNSLTVKVTAKGGSNPVAKYFYTKDNSSFTDGIEESTFVYQGLLEETEYDLKIKVADSAGKESDVYTLENEATPDYVEPEVTAKITEETTHSFKVTATGTGHDGTITSYKFEITSGETKGETVKTVTSSNPTESVTFDDLNSNTDYIVKVTLTDSNNRTVSANASKKTLYEEVTISGVSTQPTWNSVKLDVTATPGTNEITNYYFKKEGGEWIDNKTNPSYTFTGLDEKQTIKFQVKTKDAGNHEVTYDKEISVTTPDYNTPTFTHTEIKKWNSIKVDINAKANQSGATITNYYFTLGSNAEVDNGNNPSITYTSANGISDNQTYTIKVRVKDSNNKYSETTTITVQTPEYKKPTVSATVDSKSITASGFTISVTGAANEENTSIKQYEFSLDGKTYEPSLTTVSNQASITKEITGKPSNTSYTVKVRITDSNDRTSESTEVSVKTLYVNPKMDSIEFKSSTWKSITVEAHATGGSNSIRGYKFAIGSGSYSTEQTDATKTFNDLADPDTGYAIRVIAVDQDGIESEPMSETYKTAVYNPVTFSGSTTTDITDTSMTVKITATKGTGTVSKVEMQKSNEGTTWHQASVSGSTYSYNFTSLSAGTSYTFNVRATDSNDKTFTTTINGTTKYKVSVTVDHGSSSPTQAYVDKNGSTSFKISTTTEYDLTKASATPSNCSIDTLGNLTANNITSNTTCAVKIPLKQYSVSITVNGGKVTTTNPLKVDHGGTGTFTIEANDGYDINSAKVTSGSCTLGSVNGKTRTLTASNVTSARSCTVDIPKLIPLKDYIVTQVGKNVGSGSLLLHNSILTNGANDNGYRYSGNNPNNFICFGDGSEEYNRGDEGAKCDPTNQYRIIGLVPVTVGSSSQTLVKVIKSEYITEQELKGTNTEGKYGDSSSGLSVSTSYAKSPRIQTTTNIHSFHWNGSSNNTWDSSTLKTALNGKYLKTTLGSTWEEKIEEVEWNVGGTDTNRYTPNQMREKEESSTPKIKAQIGLMYLYDYGFASEQNSWKETLYNYDNSNGIQNRENNWLFNGVPEWTISRDSSRSSRAFGVYGGGGVDSYNGVSSNSYGVRPVFYLKSNVEIKSDGADGSSEHPFRVYAYL